MLRGERPVTAADTRQAEFWRDWLLGERSELVRQLSSLRNELERCAASTGTGRLGHLRGAIRAVENEIRVIDRMTDALSQRFPGAVPTLQRA
jgi:hypothetical protein